MQDSNISNRLTEVIAFLKLLDKLNTINRKVWISSGRPESDSEHSYQLAMFVLLLEKDLPKETDITKLLRMVLIHDMIEIYSGDVFAFDKAGQVGKSEREMEAAKKLFGQLPKDLEKEFLDLFVEFEERKTLEARIAKAMDRIQPFVQNIVSGGRGWWELGVNMVDIETIAEPHRKVAPIFDEMCKQLFVEIQKDNLTREE